MGRVMEEPQQRCAGRRAQLVAARSAGAARPGFQAHTTRTGKAALIRQDRQALREWGQSDREQEVAVGLGEDGDPCAGRRSGWERKFWVDGRRCEGHGDGLCLVPLDSDALQTGSCAVCIPPP